MQWNEKAFPVAPGGGCNLALTLARVSSVWRLQGGQVQLGHKNKVECSNSSKNSLSPGRNHALGFGGIESPVWHATRHNGDNKPISRFCASGSHCRSFIPALRHFLFRSNSARRRRALYKLPRKWVGDAASAGTVPKYPANIRQLCGKSRPTAENANDRRVFVGGIAKSGTKLQVFFPAIFLLTDEIEEKLIENESGPQIQ
jgi:hypothetical protein